MTEKKFGSNRKAGTVIDFPFGSNRTATIKPKAKPKATTKKKTTTKKVGE
tara:strand:- start:276 stop:425 length:150 start_codon:yes stop_codon:yes gene_type:complete